MENRSIARDTQLDTCSVVQRTRTFRLVIDSPWVGCRHRNDRSLDRADKSHSRPVGNEIGFGCRYCGDQVKLTVRANVALAQMRLKVLICEKSTLCFQLVVTRAASPDRARR